jgi:hypothetical protein
MIQLALSCLPRMQLFWFFLVSGGLGPDGGGAARFSVAKPERAQLWSSRNQTSKGRLDR